jgi:hypothetical protein
MNTVRNIVVSITLAAIAMSGAAQARGNGDRDGTRRDDTRVEQRAERRASRDRAGIDGYDRVDRRQDRQRARLIQGRRSGELTRGEFRKLKKQQRKIGRMERRFSSDGFLSGKERRRLERAQDRASRRIARLKHNDIYRGSGNRYTHWNKDRRGAYKRRW